MVEVNVRFGSAYFALTTGRPFKKQAPEKAEAAKAENPIYHLISLLAFISKSLSDTEFGNGCQAKTGSGSMRPDAISVSLAIDFPDTHP
jgi:hypothetical protein